MSSGGPAGVDDNFLRLTALGSSGAGSRLTAHNIGSQWAGNYLSAGVQSISMDVRNPGLSDLSLRLSFEDALAGPPNSIAYSASAIVVPAGSDWTSITFPIGALSLTAQFGTVDSTLMDVQVLRLYHSDAPNFPNPVNPISPVAAFLDVDNIRAAGPPNFPAVPDASSTGLLFACAAGVLCLVRSRWSTFPSKPAAPYC
jgi:hypothetical protein